MGKLGDTSTMSEALAPTGAITGKKLNTAMYNRQGAEGLATNAIDTMEYPWTESNSEYFRGAVHETVLRLVLLHLLFSRVRCTRLCARVDISARHVRYTSTLCRRCRRQFGCCSSQPSLPSKVWNGSTSDYILSNDQMPTRLADRGPL